MGHKTKIVGTWGNTHEVSIKPTCSECINKKQEKKEIKEKENLIKNIIPTIKMFYTCPICENHARFDDTKIFKTVSKSEMKKHLSTHSNHELEKYK